VLEPGDQEKLTAAVPLPTAPAKAPADASTGAAAQAAVQPLVQVGGVVREPPRLAAAEELVGRLVVCWEMITGAAAAGVLPHGCVPLEPLDVAANLTPGMFQTNLVNPQDCVVAPTVLQISRRDKPSRRSSPLDGQKLQS
jgi:hypothetical protein